jgi:hypothetical protein
MSAPEYPTYGGSLNPSSPTERASDDATRLAETAKSDLADLGEEVSQQAAALGEEAQAQVGELAKQAKGMMGEQKDLLAEQLGGVSDALQKVAAELEDNGQVSAQYVRMVADGAERLTTSLRDNNVDDIFDLVQDFGRKQPVAFLGAAALLGFSASRFVAASASRRTAAKTEEAGAEPMPHGSSNTPDYAQSVGGNDAGI